MDESKALAAMEKLTTEQLIAFLEILEARQDNDIEKAHALVYGLSEADTCAILSVLQAITSERGLPLCKGSAPPPHDDRPCRDCRALLTIRDDRQREHSRRDC